MHMVVSIEDCEKMSFFLSLSIWFSVFVGGSGVQNMKLSAVTSRGLRFNILIILLCDNVTITEPCVMFRSE